MMHPGPLGRQLCRPPEGTSPVGPALVSRAQVDRAALMQRPSAAAVRAHVPGRRALAAPRGQQLRLVQRGTPDRRRVLGAGDTGLGRLRVHPRGGPRGIDRADRLRPPTE